MIPGRGVRARVAGKTVLVGNPELLREHGVSMTPPFPAEEAVQNGCTVIYLAADGVFAGYIVSLTPCGGERGHGPGAERIGSTAGAAYWRP